MVRTLRATLIALALLVIAGNVFAYRLIAIPTAEALPEGMYKLEVSAPHNDLADEGSPTHDCWLPAFRFDGTIFKGVDISIKGGCPPDNWRASNTQVGLTWTIARETQSTPGYGIGILNWYDSDDHRATKESLFAGVFKTVDVGLKLPIKAHLLTGTKQCNGVFGGVVIPLSKRFSAAMEYLPEGTSDTKSLMLPGQDSQFVWAVGYNQNEHWRFKYANIGGDHALGVVYTSKWLQK